MSVFESLAPSQIVLIAGLVLTLLGVALVAISFGRRLNDAGELLRGFLLGAGLSLLLGGLAFNTEVPRSTLSPSAIPPKIATPATPDLVNLGDRFAQEVRLSVSYFRYRIAYAVPICTIVVLLLSGLVTRRWFRRLFGADYTDFLRGLFAAALIPLAFFAAGNYVDFGKFRHGTYFNAYEFYHYYIGTKYAPEVGYSHMYNASLIADGETSEINKYSKATLRDLSNGAHVKKEVMLARKDEIKALFSEARWQEFLKDIRFFKTELNAGRWSGILSDKGYNGTPYWTMWVGGLLSERVDTSNRSGMMALALLDPLLICIALLCVWRAFGLRPMLLLIILIGCSYVMRFSHMKGAFLRTDFAMSLVIAVCMLKLRHFRTAGALMMYAALARVFPAVFFFGAGVKLVQNVVLHWRPRLRSLIHGLIALPLLSIALVAALHFGVPADWQAALTKAIPATIPIPSAALLLSAEIVIALVVSAGLVALWLFNQSPECRPYVRLFSSALLVLVVMSTAVAMDPRTGKRIVDDFASKIGRHLNDISPWRVGYKYLFINESSFARERRAMPAAPAHEAPKAPLNDGDEQVDDTVGDELNTAEIAAVATTKLPAAKSGPDPFRVARETYLDMRIAAERAWADAQAGKVFGGKKGAVAVPESRWVAIKLATYNFFKSYIPSPRGVIYREKADEWKLTMLIVLFVSFFAVLGLKDHEALAWSFVPTFFLVSPTYYYYIMLTIPMLFFVSDLERPSRRFGAILMLAMAMPGDYLYNALKFNQQFATYYWHSFMYLGLVLYMLLLAYGDGIAGLTRKILGKKNEIGAA